MDEIVKINPKDYGLEENQVIKIEEAFLPKVHERQVLIPAYQELLTAEINDETCKKAGVLRRQLVKIRTDIDKIHKSQKNYFLAAGRFVDAWKNKETEPIVQMEEKLTQIEKYYQLQEKKRLEQLQKDRAAKISPYVIDAEERDLASMDDDVWDVYYNTKKKAWEDEQEAIRKAEKEREEKEKKERLNQNRRNTLVNKDLWQFRTSDIEQTDFGTIDETEFQQILEELTHKRQAYIAEQERMRKENERLRKEREEVERKAREEAERKAREEYEMIRKAEAEERAKKEKEQKEKAEAEEKARKQTESSKSDALKLKDLIDELQIIQGKYVFHEEKYVQKFEKIKKFLGEIIEYLS